MEGIAIRTWNNKHVKKIHNAGVLQHLKDLDLPQRRERPTLLVVYHDAFESNDMPRCAMERFMNFTVEKCYGMLNDLEITLEKRLTQKCLRQVLSSKK